MTLRRHLCMINGRAALILFVVVSLGIGYGSGAVLRQFDEVVCNDNTIYACPCSTCWTNPEAIPETLGNETTTNAEDEPLKWVAIELTQCPHFTSNLERALRQKMAQWITEECSFVLDCRRFAAALNGSGFTEANVLLGGLECSEIESRARRDKTKANLYINLLINASGEITKKNLVPAERLGSVIQAREHLLSMLLSADLDAVTLVERTFPTDTETDLEESDDIDTGESTTIFNPNHIRHYIIFALCALLIGFVVTFICCCLCVFCCLSRISWSRFTSPLWYHGTSEPKVAYTSGSSRFNTASTRATGQSKQELCFLSPCNDRSTSNGSSYNNNAESQSLSPKSS